jgi:hypothetical protein
MFIFSEIVQRDDGAWSIGWEEDAPGPFSSRQFAEAVAQQLPVRLEQKLPARRAGR